MDRDFNVATLLLAFNRPTETAKVFDAVRRARPRRLYVACDGPRDGHDGDRIAVAEVRRIVSNVDWPCELHTLFQDRNLGCRYAVSSAITWLFENEEHGIILEDDCLPSGSFFNFCKWCLSRYRDDLRVWHVAGTASPVRASPFAECSYWFSFYGSIWGWATWRDRWEHYHPDLQAARDSRIFDLVMATIDKKEHSELRLRQFSQVLNGFDTWDYQWFFTRAANSGLSVVPNANLVTNIGFGKAATHTVRVNELANRPTEELGWPLREPPCVVRDRQRDIAHLNYSFRQSRGEHNRNLMRRLMTKLART